MLLNIRCNMMYLFSKWKMVGHLEAISVLWRYSNVKHRTMKDGNWHHSLKRWCAKSAIWHRSHQRLWCLGFAARVSSASADVLRQSAGLEPTVDLQWWRRQKEKEEERTALGTADLLDELLMSTMNHEPQMQRIVRVSINHELQLIYHHTAGMTTNGTHVVGLVRANRQQPTAAIRDQKMMRCQTNHFVGDDYGQIWYHGYTEFIAFQTSYYDIYECHLSYLWIISYVVYVSRLRTLIKVCAR